MNNVMVGRTGSPYRTAAALRGDEARRLVPGSRAAALLARTLIALLGLVAAALALAPWQQTTAGKGRVIAYAPVERQQAIEAPIEGRVARWHVEEGARVEEGAPIADITDNDPDLTSRLDRERLAIEDRLRAARARLGAIDARVEALRSSQGAAVAGAAARARMSGERARAAEQALDAARAVLKTAELNHERQRGLHDKGLASQRTVELVDLDLARARTEVERARAALDAARAEVAALGADQAKIGNDTSAALSDAAATRASVEAEIAAASAEIARVEVRVARQATQAVKAPRAGTILRVIARQGGEVVKAGDPLAVFVPDTGERAVEMWIDGNDVNLVQPGRAVRLQFEGWPAVQFSGWPSAAVGTYGGKVAFVDPAGDGKGSFRVMVVADRSEPWPAPALLRQGTRAGGWILLDRVSLGYELWRQFNGFPPEWTAPAEDAAGAAKKGGDK